jgi:hypothetical protein
MKESSKQVFLEMTENTEMVTFRIGKAEDRIEKILEDMKNLNEK